MVFNFITDWQSIPDMQLACLAYNLGLLYFIWDVTKWILSFVFNKFYLGGKKR